MCVAAKASPSMKSNPNPASSSISSSNDSDSGKELPEPTDINVPTHTASPPSHPVFTVEDNIITPSKPLSVSQFKQLSTPTAPQHSTEYRDQYSSKSGSTTTFTERSCQKNSTLPQTEHKTKYQWPDSSYLQQQSPPNAMTATTMTADSLESPKAAVSSPRQSDACRSTKPQR